MPPAFLAREDEEGRATQGQTWSVFVCERAWGGKRKTLASTLPPEEKERGIGAKKILSLSVSSGGDTVG